MTPKQMEKLSKKNGSELIVYQLGEVKNLLENMSIKVTNYQDKMDLRVRILEDFKTAQEAKDRIEPKLDIQKIILAAFSLISTIVAIALGIQNTK